MKIFKELKKLGYKHYTEHTVEELDDLPLDSEERIMEQALVFRWFRDKYDLKKEYGTFPHHTIMFNYLSEGGKEEEAELACLKKLIELVK